MKDLKCSGCSCSFDLSDMDADPYEKTVILICAKCLQVSIVDPDGKSSHLVTNEELSTFPPDKLALILIGREFLRQNNPRRN